MIDGHPERPDMPPTGTDGGAIAERLRRENLHAVHEPVDRARPPSGQGDEMGKVLPFQKPAKDGMGHPDLLNLDDPDAQMPGEAPDPEAQDAELAGLSPEVARILKLGGQFSDTVKGAVLPGISEYIAHSRKPERLAKSLRDQVARGNIKDPELKKVFTDLSENERAEVEAAFENPEIMTLIKEGKFSPLYFGQIALQDTAIKEGLVKQVKDAQGIDDAQARAHVEEFFGDPESEDGDEPPKSKRGGKVKLLLLGFVAAIAMFLKSALKRNKTTG